MNSIHLVTSGFAFTFLSLSTINAAELNTKTEIQFRWGASSHSDPTFQQLGELTFTPEFTVDFENEWRLNTIARLRHESANQIQPSDLDDDGYSTSSRPWLLGKDAELELREFYFDRTFGDHYLSIGKQQTVWGRADGLKVLDVVNPQSFREFILEDFEDSRIPLWTANLELALDPDSALQLLWIPDTSVHALPNRDGTFAFTTPRIVPQAPPQVDVSLSQADFPNRFFEDSDFGARWIAFKNGWDLTLNYLYHYDDLPVFNQILDTTGFAPRIELNPTFNRSHLIGGTFTNSFGNLTLRGEVAYETDQSSLSRLPMTTGGTVTHDTLSYVLGFDWFGLIDTFVSLQLFQNHLIDPTAPSALPATDSSVTLFVQRHFFNETLTAETLMLQNLNDSDGMIRPKLSYNWNDTLTTWIGADLFHGNRAGLFGQFKDNNRLLLGARYSF